MTTTRTIVNVQLNVEPELARAWAVLAERAGLSKAELFRRLVRRLSEDEQVLRELIQVDPRAEMTPEQEVPR